VDADVAKPSVPANLGIPNEAGLMDWLADDTLDIGSLVRPTNVDKLSILPAGRQHGLATEMLASDAMARLLDQLTARFSDRILIFDSPPLMVTTESRVLASYMGQVVMVVEAGRTPREAVKEALGMLGTGKVVGVVLNKSHDGGAAGKYGYGRYAYGAERG
jgi:receptor protein-tyrosine kinase